MLDSSETKEEAKLSSAEIFFLVFCDKDFWSGFHKYQVSPSLPSFSELPRKEDCSCYVNIQGYVNIEGANTTSFPQAWQDYKESVMEVREGWNNLYTWSAEGQKTNCFHPLPPPQ